MRSYDFSTLSKLALQVPNFDLQTQRPGAEKVPSYFDESNQAVLDAVKSWELAYDPEQATKLRRKAPGKISNFAHNISREQAIHGTRQAAKGGPKVRVLPCCLLKSLLSFDTQSARVQRTHQTNQTQQTTPFTERPSGAPGVRHDATGTARSHLLQGTSQGTRGHLPAARTTLCRSGVRKDRQREVAGRAASPEQPGTPLCAPLLPGPETRRGQAQQHSGIEHKER